MLHRYVLAFSLFLTFTSAHSQVSTAGAGAMPVPLSRQDTARAVHELFKSRRGGGFSWLAFGGAGMAASIIPAQQTTSAGVWTPGVVIGSALAALGIKKLAQFGWGREHRVLSALAATGYLPADVKRRLRGNFAPLHGTASAPNPFLAAGIVSSASIPAPPLPGPAAPTSTASVTTPTQLLADARQDTLDAVQGFFNAKQLGGQLPLLLALPGLRLMTGASNTNYSPSPYLQSQSSEPGTGQVVAGLALMAGGAAYMFIHNAPYTATKFATLRNDYLAGKPLPADIRTKLKARHLVQGRAYRERLDRKAARRAKRNS
ncbi:hypothetical protein [Hymenobacter sp. PAMC 26628]|uniref:hypothetical protein n=1 Tax=Hymenobacter sp. PAMC 26628 TaxID=1484118 RepID=UPI0007701746|nr:hypothetical protein [Hymenobacter sp. PAMC 26628]AMJ64587.1 hypothetical protein AXW84_03470 [Hymenobacter sp. PAMC 26628]